MSAEIIEGFAIVELMGHRKLAGRISRAEILGTEMLRVDVIDPAGATIATQFYNGGSIYALTFCGEKEARAAAATSSSWQPVTRYEVKMLEAGRPTVVEPESFLERQEREMRDAGYSDAEISGHDDDPEDEPESDRSDSLEGYCACHDAAVCPDAVAGIEERD